jgi:predicted nucleic acid-binding protein
VIVLDTNVLSEPLRERPDPGVLDWLRDNPVSTITAISVGEILQGVARMAAGQRRASLAADVHRALAEVAAVLAYDDAAARIYADIQEHRRGIGRPLSIEDGMIAAICLSRGATLATRNVKDFEQLGLELVNPWGQGA